MTAGDMADGIGHRDDRQSERERNPQQADSQPGEGRGEDRAAAPAEYQPERADTLGGHSSAHRHSHLLNVPAAPFRLLEGLPRPPMQKGPAERSNW